MLLKTDWVAIGIATFGVAFLTYYAWDTRNVYPALRKLLYALLGLMAVLWALIVFMLIGENNVG